MLAAAVLLPSRLCLQLSVHIKRLVRLDLHLPYAVAWQHALLNGRLELIAPWTPPAVAVAVVVAAQEVALGLRALLCSKRDIDGFEQVLFERGVQTDNSLDVLLDVLRVEAPKEVTGRC